MKERDCVLILESLPHLFIAQDKSLDQTNHTNPDQDEGANYHPRDVGRPDDLYEDSDAAEESQTEASLPGFAAEDQRRTAGETDGDHWPFWLRC